METVQTIPAHPVNTEGLDVPELFKQVLADLSESTEAEAFGYNIDVLTPQNFNEVMFSGFQEVLNGTRSAGASRPRRCRRLGRRQRSRGRSPTQE